MNLTLHIFKKDFRRLWPAVLVTLLLMAELVRLDCWRNDWLATTEEGWLNLLLPLTWACLIALLVQQESLVGDRHFWLTWPYTWQTLLGSKALFILVLIHFPVLLADATVLAFHGFQPAQYASHLIWKQVLLAATITAPALALATLFDNIAAFLLTAVVIVGVAAYLSGAYEPMRAPWLRADEIRPGLAMCVLALTAGVIILVQYARRRTAPSRMAGAGALVFAALLFGYLPPTVTARVRSMLHPTTGDIALRLLSNTPEQPPQIRTSRGAQEFVQIALPIAVSGISDTQEVRFNALSVVMVGPDGQQYQTPPKAARRNPGPNPAKVDFNASTVPYGQRPNWLFLRLRRSIMNRINDRPVTIRAAFEVNLHRTGETTWIPVGAARTVVGVGTCSSVVIDSPSAYQESMLKVLCASPYSISPETEVRLWQPKTGGEWKQHLGDSAPYSPGPRESFLSPLNRLQTFFHVVSNTPYNSPQNGWLVPREALENGKLAITPDVITGWATTHFELQECQSA